MGSTVELGFSQAEQGGCRRETRVQRALGLASKEVIEDSKNLDDDIQVLSQKIYAS
jgi:hypothetical protein